MRSMVEGCPPYRERDTPPAGLTACHLPFQGRNGSISTRPSVQSRFRKASVSPGAPCSGVHHDRA